MPPIGALSATAAYYPLNTLRKPFPVVAQCRLLEIVMYLRTLHPWTWHMWIEVPISSGISWGNHIVFQTPNNFRYPYLTFKHRMHSKPVFALQVKLHILLHVIFITLWATLILVILVPNNLTYHGLAIIPLTKKRRKGKVLLEALTAGRFNYYSAKIFLGERQGYYS